MWISANDEVKPITDEDGYSARYPIKVKDLKGWTTGRYIKTKLGSRWIAETVHGDYEVTDWYDIPKPPEEE